MKESLCPRFLKASVLALLCQGTSLLAGPGSAPWDNALTRPGNFVVGCNYWASHAGTRMWSDWRSDVVDADFQKLSENGVSVIRIFPLWPDFQPIVQLYGYRGAEHEIAFADGPLPATAVGAAGVSEASLQKFQTVADLAQQHHLKLIVSLVTGWMSGELFVPPALQGKNLLTDATALTWEQRYVKTFVHRFQSHPAIIGWDLGNECNCLAAVDNSDQAYAWSALISDAIRAEDPSRPVLSGMHSLKLTDGAAWRIQDQAQATDLLTTHPYPFFTPYTELEPLNTIRPLLHAAAETRLYAGVGGKPCIIEEAGSLGPTMADEAVTADYVRTLLFSGWANDCHGLLWWCAFDLDQDYPPYSWTSMERNLGLMRADRSARPALDELKKFTHFLEGLPFKTLPPRKTEAVCVLTEGQDSWAAAYSAFILAKEAGFDLEFQKAGQTLKDAPLYLVPSLDGFNNLNKADWLALLAKAEQGATLYLSVGGGFLAPLTEPFGWDIVVNSSRSGPASFLSTNLGGLTFNLPAPRKMVLQPRHARVLASEIDGNPVLTETQYGKGTLYFLSLPLETDLAKAPGVFNPSQPACYKIYQQIAKPLIKARTLTQTNPYIAVTEHSVNANEKVIILINCSSLASSSGYELQAGWKVGQCLHGQPPASRQLSISANNALVITVTK